MRKITLIAAGLTLAALAGCWESDGDAAASDAVQATVPASATASPQAYVQFVGSQAADDRAEPISLEGAMPPVSDTEEPDEVS